jgi:hypothetical protein
MSQTRRFIAHPLLDSFCCFIDDPLMPGCKATRPQGLTQGTTTMRISQFLTLILLLVATRAAAVDVAANRVAEITLMSEKAYEHPFTDVQFDAIVTRPDGAKLRIPGFWAGGKRWCFRYSSNAAGTHGYRTECSDAANTALHGAAGKIEVTPAVGDNPLYLHGPIHVANDRRHFEHIDGTPFFWLGDTWWKGLCKRLTWEGFQEIAADRKAKGFSVVQIVCGVYPDEHLFEPSWENEGGKPYLTQSYSEVNPAYFEYADRRIKCLVEAGMVPAIVGGWGRSGCDGMAMAGLDGMERHWRNLIARYGAYPTVWILGGESAGGEWTELARYVRKTDPYHRATTIHALKSARKCLTEEMVIDFDMLQTGHGNWNAAHATIPQVRTACESIPRLPVVVGECCYEGHMQNAFPDVQRYLFWGDLLSGAAGHTYGAAGVWHMGVEGDPGIRPVYDWTTWKEGMNYPGSAQLALNKKLLEKYPWWRFEPHQEWVESPCIAAGIPDEVRFIYQPKKPAYHWSGPLVMELDPQIVWHAFYFDPATARRFDLGLFHGRTFRKKVPSPQDWVLVLERNSRK